MSLQSRLDALITAIGADAKSFDLRLDALEASGGAGTFTAPLNLPESATSTTPASGRGLIYPKENGDWYTKNDVGIEVNLTDPLKGGRGWLIPNSASTSITQIGIGSLAATGTATAATRAITNKHTRQRRLDYLVTVAATTAVAGWRTTGAHLLRGNAAGVGGFFTRTIWGPATGVATTTNRAFVGLTATTGAPTDVEPSTQVTCFGMGWDAADANIQIMHNDATSTCTKINLGASFPVPTVDRTSLYQCDLWCPPNDTKLYYTVTDLISGATVSGNTGVSTDLPANTTYLAERGWMSVGGTSSVIGISFVGYHFQTESF